MRPGQNKRMRGRNNNNNGGNRRGPNPLTRSYESNGPDVKIRGTAQHIGEKYLQLARDAQTSGDPVAAENYLQHAEHYFRLIAAAQQAQQQAQVGYQRQPGEAEAEDVDGDEDVVMPDRFALPSERFGQQQNGSGQQPYPDRQNFNGGERPAGQDRPERQGGDNNTPYRGERDQRPYNDQRSDREPRQDRDQRQDREPRSERYDQRGDRESRPYQNEQRPYGDRGNSERSGERPQYEQRDRGYRNDRNSRNSRYSRDGQDGAPRNGHETGGLPEGRETSVPDHGRPDLAAQPQPDVGADLPAFITAPVRPAALQSPNGDTPGPAQAALEGATAPMESVSDAEPESFAARPRRRRRTRAMIEAEANTASAPADDEPAAD